VLERPGGSPAALHGPAATLISGCWHLLTDAPRVLTHYDYWSGNTLWDNGTLTGVVDWSGAALGPPGFDVGWCRLDLYLLYGEHIADQFLDSYLAASEQSVPDRCCGTCGPRPGLITMSRTGCRTIAIWGAAT